MAPILSSYLSGSKAAGKAAAAAEALAEKEQAIFELREMNEVGSCGCRSAWPWAAVRQACGCAKQSNGSCT
jgi:hypothetical protein